MPHFITFSLTIVETWFIMLIALQFIRMKIHRNERVFFIISCSFLAATTFILHEIDLHAIRLVIFAFLLTWTIAIKKMIPMYYALVGVLFSIILVLFLEMVIFSVLPVDQEDYYKAGLVRNLAITANILLMGALLVIFRKKQLYFIDIFAFSNVFNGTKKPIATISSVLSLSFLCAIFLFLQIGSYQVNTWYITFILFCFFVFLFKYSINKQIKDMEREMQRTHEEHLKINIMNERKIRHDFIFHLNTIYAMADLGQTKELKKYIEELSSEVRLVYRSLPLEEVSLSNLIINFEQMMNHDAIQLHIKIDDTLKGMPLKPHEITSVFANLLTNAYEHVKKHPHVKQEVELRVYAYDFSYRIEVTNEVAELKVIAYFEEPYVQDASKERGYGLLNVLQTIHSYNGQVFPELNADNQLTIVLIIPRR
ncbi:sensor histidine kinase [Shouchella sp. JSM 1781072]|uniref:sensor histidine kinase n=1 Tax=Shouchella sp. JSM 1781072 TaxID=3344581 RepID=UPI0035BF97D6